MFTNIKKKLLKLADNFKKNGKIMKTEWKNQTVSTGYGSYRLIFYKLYYD